MVLCYLDETMAKHILHGPKAFVCRVDLNRTVKDTTRDFTLSYWNIKK
jgi:hypothetical protein